MSNVKVIARSLRKGNMVEKDGHLYVILTAENIHPGKGTPVTQLDMRRISDGVKVSERYRTTEQVERAFVEDKDYNFLYEDSDGFNFMNNENYDQVSVSKDVVGDRAPFLQEGMECQIALFNDAPISIELPQRVTLEIVETGEYGLERELCQSRQSLPVVIMLGCGARVPLGRVAAMFLDYMCRGMLCWGCRRCSCVRHRRRV
jgi:elongation factor P